MYQRYGQYEEQFIDRNPRQIDDIDNTDTQDDKNLFDGPDAVGDIVRELYLIDKKQKTRTFFRWHIQKDQKISTPCILTPDPLDPKKVAYISDGCVGNIQMLKLK